MRVMMTFRGLFALFVLFVTGSSPVAAQLGEDWREAWQYPPRTLPASTVHDGRLWVSGGQIGAFGAGGDGELEPIPLRMISRDEITFPTPLHPLTTTARRAIEFPVPPLFINRSDVWVSEDGSHWSPVTHRASFPERFLHTMTSFNGVLWVMGGIDEQGDTLNDIWFSNDGETWYLVTDNADWSPRAGHSVTVFDGGMWLIGGSESSPFGSERVLSDEVWFSSDGLVWTNLSLSTNFPPRFGHGVTVHDDALWLAGGIPESAGILSDVWASSDGAAWTEVTQGLAPLPPSFFTKLASFQGRLWAAGGGDPADPFAFSTNDGAYWLPSSGTGYSFIGHSLLVLHDRLHIVHGGTFVFSMPEADTHLSTADGSEWSVHKPSRAFSSRYGHSLVAYEDELLLIGGFDSYHRSDVWTTHDGIHWDQLRSNPTLTNRLAHRAFVAPNTSGVQQINLLAGVGDSGYRRDRWTSTNAVDWSLTETGTMSSFVFNNGRFGLIVDDRNPAAVQVLAIGGLAPGNVPTKEVHRKTFSSVASGWVPLNTNPPFPPRHGHGAALFNNRYWVIGGANSSSFLNDVWSSSDGVTWVPEVPVGPHFDPRTDHVVMVHDGALWVIGGIGTGGIKKDAWFTTNGTVWTRATDSLPFPNGLYLEGISWRDSMWVVIGVGSNSIHSSVWRSSDGATWQQMNPGGSFGARRGHAMVTFDGGMAVTGGFDGEHVRGDSWWSPDGRMWEPMSGLIPERRYHAATAHNGRIYVMGGEADDGSFRNDVWSTTGPGTNWTQDNASAAFTQRRYHASTSFNGFLQLMGGQDPAILSDIRRSTNGVSWTGGSISALGGRIGHRLFALDDHLYIVAGYNFGYLRDMWKSTDGIGWTEVSYPSEASRPPAKFHHRGAVLGERMWLIGGYSEDTASVSSDVWSSQGQAWTREATSTQTPFSNRQFHDVAALDSTLWVTGGLGSSDPHLSDVWISNDPPRVISLNYLRTDYAHGETLELDVEFNKDVTGFATSTAIAVAFPHTDDIIPFSLTPLEGTRRWRMTIPYPDLTSVESIVAGVWRPWDIRDKEGAILQTSGGIAAVIHIYPPSDYMAIHGPGGIIILP